MDFIAIITGLMSAYPCVTVPLTALGSLVVIAQIVVPLTPTKKDDKLLGKAMEGIPGKFLRALTQFAVIQKK